MIKPLAVVIASFVCLGAGLAAIQTPASRGSAIPQAAVVPAPVPAAPPPGSAGTFKPGVDLMDVLKRQTAPASGMTTSAVSNTDQYRINIVRRAKPAGAIAHPGNTELHYIISGSGTFVSGGTIVRPAGAAADAATIADGVTRHVKPGDVVIVPAGSAHWYKDIEGDITYLEVRWLAHKP